MKNATFLFSLLCSLLSAAQNTFVKTIGTSETDFGTSCIGLPDNGTVLTICGGSPSGNVQFGLVKTDYSGTVQWEKLFGHGSFLYPEQVVETADQGFLVFGNMDSPVSALHSTFLLKTDADGNDLWMKSISGSDDDRAAGLIACQNGGYISCSVTNDNGTGQYAGALLVKYDEAGTVVWSKEFHGYFDVSPVDLTELPDGSIAFVSSTKITFGDSFKHILVTKVSAAGDLAWSSSFSADYDDNPSAIAASASGELYVTGTSYRMGGEWDGFLLKVGTQGERIFNRFYNAGTPDGEKFRDLAVRPDGSIVLVGDLGTFDGRDISLLNTNAQGDVIWSKRYPLSPQFTNYPYDLFLSYGNGIVFTGDVRSPSYVRDAALVRTDGSGNIPCFNETISYTVSSEPFLKLSPPLTVSVPVLSIVAVVPEHPAENITEKIVCEDAVPPASFGYELASDGVCPVVCLDFSGTSLDTPLSWAWEFEGGDPAVSSEQNPHVCFPVSGSYAVKLSVTNADGTTVVQQEILLTNDCPPMPIPNVVTPDGDGVNDLFFIQGLPANSVFHIVNRWGTEVFVSDAAHQEWNGKDQSGKDVSEGVYFYVLETPKERYHGFLQVVR